MKDRLGRVAMLVALVISILLPTVSSAADSALAPSTYVYRESSDDKFSLDAYGIGASVSAQDSPALVFFHGGGWAGGGKKQFSRQARFLTHHAGLIIISVDYPANRSPIELTEAALAAVCWVKAHAGQLGIRIGRIVASGSSAGGQLAAAVALAGAKSVPECTGITRPYADALVLFNPVLDLKGTWERKFGMSLSEVSPIDLLDRSLPPTLILQGTEDRTTPVTIARDFVTKARELGNKDIQLIEYPGRGHGFFNRAESGDLNATLNDTIQFLKHLGWL